MYFGRPRTETTVVAESILREVGEMTNATNFPQWTLTLLGQKEGGIRENNLQKKDGKSRSEPFGPTQVRTTYLDMC